jgi:hypothetical protein
MKPPNILSVERGPICQKSGVLTNGNAIIIPDRDCVKSENNRFFHVPPPPNRSTAERPASQVRKYPNNFCIVMKVFYFGSKLGIVKYPSPGKF